MVDMVQEAFDAADFYRNPVMVVGDGMIGQMMEPVEFKPYVPTRTLQDKKWATDGTKGKRKPNIINSLFLDPALLEEHNVKLQAKYKAIKENEARAEVYNMENARVAIVAYGTTSRIAKNAIAILKSEGIEVGLIRPMTLWPFPDKAFESIPDTCEALLSVEMSMGQMLEDIKVATHCKLPVEFYGRSGGMIPEPDAIVEKIKAMLGGAQ
jgi:2-oxoglutarate ferredoxin oxidoreductase subunit alpha